MKIDIQSVQGHGDFDKEYVTLKVQEDCDAGRFLLADTTYTKDGKVSALLRHIFWIPDQQVKRGDFIRIHTKPGKISSVANQAGTTTYHFYWGLKTAVWNDQADCAVLYEIGSWQQKSAK